jgi:regulator of protease activity HflC (stomatin/prohibitin superfamily)
MSVKLKAFAIVAVGLVVVGGLAAVAGWKTVDEGHVKVAKYKGDSVEELKPGTWYWKNPLTYSYKSIDVRPQIYTMVDRSDEGAKHGDDSVKVKDANQLENEVDVAVTYNVTDASKFHDRWKNHTKARNILIRNPSRAAIYTVGGNMTTENITTDDGREKMRGAIVSRLRQRFAGEPIELMSVEVRDVRPDQSYLEERREVKEREQQVKQAELEAEAEIKRAEGAAEANRIVKESLDQELLTYRQIQALRNSSAVYVPVGDDGLPTYLNVNQNQTQTQNATAPGSA